MSEQKEELIVIPSSWAATTRDQFAMAALTGILACSMDHKGFETVNLRVQKSYEYADAMLAERDKK